MRVPIFRATNKSFLLRAGLIFAGGSNLYNFGGKIVRSSSGLSKDQQCATPYWSKTDRSNIFLNSCYKFVDGIEVNCLDLQCIQSHASSGRY